MGRSAPGMLECVRSGRTHSRRARHDWVEPALSSAARNAIAGPANQIHVSAATAWEITTEHRIGKPPAAGPVAADVAREIAAEGFAGLPVTVRHAQQAGAIPGPHKDPFDRMLIAQALTEAMTLVSNEVLFDAYGVARLWREQALIPRGPPRTPAPASPLDPVGRSTPTPPAPPPIAPPAPCSRSAAPVALAPNRLRAGLR